MDLLATVITLGLSPGDLKKKSASDGFYNINKSILLISIWIKCPVHIRKVPVCNK